QERLAALGIPLSRVEQALGNSNLNLPGGALRGDERQFLIRTLNEYTAVRDVGEVIIDENDGRVVRVLDVAKVYRGTKEREEITRVDGVESVEIAIFKEGDANAVQTVAALRARLETWRKKLPPGYELKILFDQSRFIQSAVTEVRDATLIGGGLAILVLLLFLRDFRSTAIIDTAIPLSVVATFIAMYRMDISLNIMSLGGLTLGVGMLVDNAIVVLEAIYRQRQNGASRPEAAVRGASEVGPAVVASTMTTVAVFLPIVFVEGIAGQLFKDQALTVAISLLASLLVAITVIPMLSAQAITGSNRAESLTSIAPDDDEIRTLGFFSSVYDRLLRAAIRFRSLTLVIAGLLFATAVFAVPKLKTELIPRLSTGEFNFELKMPEGTALPATDRIVARMEAHSKKSPEVDIFFSTVGSRQAPGGVSVNSKGENLAQLNLALKNKTSAVEEETVSRRLREAFADIPDARIRLGHPDYFTLQTPIEVVIFGEELEALRVYSIALARQLEDIEGLVDVRSSLEAGNPELQIVFDRDRIAALNLDLATLSETLKNRVQGVVPTRFKEADRQIDIRLLNREENRSSIADVRQLVLPGPEDRPIRLLSVADLVPARGPAEIHRLQQQRAALVTANLKDVSLGDAANRVEAVLGQQPPPPGMTAKISGQNREMQVSFGSLRFAVALAIFLVYLVMASTFESVVHPFVVLFTIPLALVGVVAGLVITQTSISVIVLIGVVMLVGIVVNNAIVLIDAMNRFRRQGLDKIEAVVRAGHVRLRPILMTTLTTVLALIPMAIGWGEGGELRAPLAITVMSGLILSTLLTLLVIPATYVLVPSSVPPEPSEETTS
ncbi:MAG: efflux RND transporter permease subunit, partial [Myxococcota bacterium]